MRPKVGLFGSDGGGILVFACSWVPYIIAPSLGGSFWLRASGNTSNRRKMEKEKIYITFANFILRLGKYKSEKCESTPDTRKSTPNTRLVY